MSDIAILFRSAPHGSASGREGLDALLACSALSDELAAFFIADGVYQLLSGQQPAAVLGRDYVATFKLLELYDIEQVYVCAESLTERGLSEASLLIPVTVLDRPALREKIGQAKAKLVF